MGTFATTTLCALALALVGCSDDSGGVAGSGGGAGASGGGAGGFAGGSGGWAGTAGSSGSSGSAGSGGSSGSCAAASPSLARVGTTFDVPTLSETVPKRNPDIAHDMGHDVYLVVSGAAVISGTFLDADGKSLAAPFAVAQTTAHTQTPRVTYGAQKFLVAWHDNRLDPNKPELRARLVGWNGSAPELGSDISISQGAQTFQEAGAGLAFSETSKLFLVVWHAIPGDDIRARRVDATGALVGAEIQVTADADWQSGVSAAWSSASDEFLVTYTHAGAGGAAVRARRVRASDGSLVGGELEVATAEGTWTTQSAYLPCDDQWFVGWVAGGGSALGAKLDATGEPAGPPFAFPAGHGYPEGFAVARHPLVGTLTAVMHGPSDEDSGLAFTAEGALGAMLEVTASEGSEGHFNPRLAANGARNEWMVVTSLGFSTIVGQRLSP